MWAEQGHSFPPWQGAHTPPHPVVGVARGRQRPVLQGPLLQGAVPESPSLDPWLLRCHIPLLLCFFFLLAAFRNADAPSPQAFEEMLKNIQSLTS